MSRFEYRVRYRREGNTAVQKQIFRQEASARRFLGKLANPREAAGLAVLPLEGFAIDRRPVGVWETIDRRGDMA